MTINDYTHDFILGTGIAGLILGIENPDYYLIGKDKGQVQGKYSLGPRIIQYSKEMESFLKDLGFNIEIDNVKVGYEYQNNIYDHLDNTPIDFREKYSLFTRGKKEYEASFLSGGQNTIKVISLDGQGPHNSFIYLADKLYEILQNENRILEQNIISVDPGSEVLVLDNGPLRFNNIISTLSQKIFQKLSPGFLKPDKLEMKVKNFLVTEYKGEKPLYFYTYGVETYSRRTIFDDYQVLEFPGEKYFNSIDEGDIIEVDGEKVQVLAKVSLPVQIKDSLKLTEHPHNPKIKFRGRFAEWNHGVLINDLLKTY